MKITLKHQFSAAHRLFPYNGKCANIHGHNYQVKIEISGPVSDNGLVLDFKAIKNICGGWIDETWDHKLLLSGEDPLVVDENINAILSEHGMVVVPFSPTAENMATFLSEVLDLRLADVFGDKYTIASITVYETANACAKWEKPCRCSK